MRHVQLAAGGRRCVAVNWHDTGAAGSEKRALPKRKVAADVHESRVYDRSMGYVYAICAQDCGPVKLGHTKHLQWRLATLQCGAPDELRICHSIKCDDPQEVERRLHETLRHRKVRPKSEWFHLTADEARAELEHALIRWGN